MLILWKDVGEGEALYIPINRSSSFTWPVPLGCNLHESFPDFCPSLSETGRLEGAGDGYFLSSTLVRLW